MDSRSLRRSVAVFAASSVIAMPAGAQDSASWAPTVAVGSRVRVVVDSPAVSRVAGEYRGFARGDLHLTVRDRGAVAIPSRRVIYLDASGGRERMRYMLKWSLYGAGIGAIAGALIGEQEDPGGVAGIAGLIGGAIVGLPVGAIAGALWAPERWIRHFNYSRGQPSTR